MRAILIILALWCTSAAVWADDLSSPAILSPVGTPCEREACEDRVAVFFVHGIYGDESTFRSEDGFDWPARMPRELAGKSLDYYVVKYRTQLMSWAKADIASFDDVVESITAALHGKISSGDDRVGGLLKQRPYQAMGFIAHSLGGNVAAAYIHSIKSEFGHTERSKISFLITLGTPANGAQLADVGSLLKSILGMNDPLLKSLERDNTFLRMLAFWRRSENIKATRFHCRPVDLYVGVEGKRLFGLATIVDRDSAVRPYARLARDVRFFAGHDHNSIVKPSAGDMEVYDWVTLTLEKQMRKLASWTEPLCRSSHGAP